MIKCLVEDCSKEVVTRGYCGAHYQRFRKAKSIDIGYKNITKHPYYVRWSKLRSNGDLCEVWLDFKTYVKDIGESNGCSKINRLDGTKPFGPDNFKWAEELVGEVKNRYYQKKYREDGKHRNGLYKKQYGITLDEYNQMFANQKGLCAICHREERRVVRNGVNENKRMLSIDHSHKTGAVRALLCSDCNPSLGGFKDDVEILKSAIRYLEKYGV